MEAALASPSIPPEIVTTLLNLAEFMEHDDKTLPLDARRACCQTFSHPVVGTSRLR
jgi:phosphatidylinositol kinase/protein kinase (PI-3  family)